MTNVVAGCLHLDVCQFVKCGVSFPFLLGSNIVLAKQPGRSGIPLLHRKQYRQRAAKQEEPPNDPAPRARPTNNSSSKGERPVLLAVFLTVNLNPGNILLRKYSDDILDGDNTNRSSQRYKSIILRPRSSYPEGCRRRRRCLDFAY